MADETHLTWHSHSVSREQREQLNGHRGCLVWFTGLSGCGKSTVANLTDQKLHAAGVRTFVLDGDNIRHGLNASTSILRGRGDAYAERFGLGFSAADRQENIRRIGAVGELFAAAGIVTLAAFVSPFRSDRDEVRGRLERARAGDFIEVFVDTPLEVCEQRDPKGLYKRARAGEIKDFTGIDSPYEPPRNAELTLAGGEFSAEQLAEQVVAYLREQAIIT